MKNSRSARKRSGDYSKLKNKVFLRLLAIIIGSCIAVVLLRLLVHERLGNLIVAMFQRFFGLDFYAAMTMYNTVIRSNITLIVVVTIIICTLILFRFLIKWLTGYFDELAEGLDAVIDGGDKMISLSSEMGFLERKLITLRQTIDKQRYDAQLEEQSKSDLVMYLAHDLKTPLTSIIGYLSLLNEAPEMSIEQRAKYLRITLEKANRLEKLINEFFEITRYNIHGISLETREVDLYYMLVQMADEFYPYLASSGKRATIRAAQDLTIVGDPDKLARVFNNILKNAIAYGDANSVIEISADAYPDRVELRFKNAGHISQQKLDQIFEKFYRLDDARSSDTGGAGLGLAIAKEIVTLHGGEIKAECRNNVTMFTVSLPTPVTPSVQRNNNYQQ